MPLYQKYNSYGEYVFDWSWAHAYRQSRISYYPKLLTAIPFTPCAGPRLSVAPDKSEERSSIYSYCIDALIQHSRRNFYSSWHLLFPEEAEDEEICDILNQKLMMRSGSQYHWYNEDYQSFDDYLQAMKARKRNSIRKERLKVAEQGIEFVHLSGNQMSADLVDDFLQL